MKKYADYVINRCIGDDDWDPTDTAFTEEEAREKAKNLSITGYCVDNMTEVVYSPVEDPDVDELIARYCNGQELPIVF